MVRRLRTAVLVVHGMGSQRPLETVRGVINAVWFDDDDHTKGSKKLWSHPQPSGVDLDLTVMTTSTFKDKTDDRNADFHELYWAHLMSETKPVAVLLWLFELARKGPHLKTGMKGLWWCGAVYMCLLLLSVALVALRGIVWIAEVVCEPESIVIIFYIMFSVAFLAGLIAALIVRWRRLLTRMAMGFLVWLVLGAIGIGAAWLLTWWGNQYLEASQALKMTDSAVILASIFLPIGSAFVAAKLLMAKWGTRAFAWTLLLSLAFFVIYILLARFGIFGDETLITALRAGRIPWSMASNWSAVAAWVIIGVYLMMNAAFLQPYLGDAARYFRNSPANVAVRREIRREAVNTLDRLHRSRDYDRIVVVAHSLGTAVAYDMLRAYYSRICQQIPIDEKILNPQFSVVNGKMGKGAEGEGVDCDAMRVAGRQLIGNLARRSRLIAEKARQGLYQPARSEEVDAWLVTDFVTLGSPLTHACYFMAQGKDEKELDGNFAASVREREYPTCPPKKLDGDGRIAFKDPNTNKLRLHHGGVFGMTRWTNLFFPMKEIFWGDAIGGPLRNPFGECVKDREVTTKKAGGPSFFTHVAYWKTDCPDKRKGPHLKVLIDAIDLADKEKAPATARGA